MIYFAKVSPKNLSIKMFEILHLHLRRTAIQALSLVFDRLRIPTSWLLILSLSLSMTICMGHIDDDTSDIACTSGVPA